MFTQRTRSFLETTIVAICIAVVLIEATASAAKKPYSDDNRILNGEDTNITNAVFMAQVRSKGNAFMCGATIVSQWHVVSAAHCYDNRAAHQIRVVVGEDELVRDPNNSAYETRPDIQSYDVLAIVNHPEYREGKVHMDVAVLRVKGQFKFNMYINKAFNWCTATPKKSQEVNVFGWGNTKYNSGSYSNKLQRITVPVMSMDKCVEVHRSVNRDITESMFCAAVVDGKDSCQGDSGGPAMVNGYFCGVVSWGVGCGSVEHSGVYTSIAVVKKFIDDAKKSTQSLK